MINDVNSCSRIWSAENPQITIDSTVDRGKKWCILFLTRWSIHCLSSELNTTQAQKV